MPVSCNKLQKEGTMFTFARFANALIYATKIGNEELVNVLLGCVCEPLSLKNKKGDAYYADKGVSSHLLSGHRDVALEIQRSTGNRVVIDGAESYFAEQLVSEIKPMLLDDFLEEMKKSITSDTSISQAKKDDFLLLANKKTLAKFLASATLYVINRPNTVQTEHIALNNLPMHNLYFSGRVDQLNRIDALFKKEKRDTINICQNISGLGGVGKTQLAIEYAYQHHCAYKDGIWFVVAENPTTIYNSFVAFSECFGLNLPSEFKPEDLQQAVSAWLLENHSWLLILDNLETIDDVSPYLPDDVNGKVIITTQNTRIEYGMRLELDVFKADESEAFLKRRFSGNTDLEMEYYCFSDFEESAKILIARLGNLPLALEQAAAYIKEVRCSITDYLELLKQSGVDAFSDRYATPEYYEKIVTSTWNISFHALGESSRQLMNLCAYMAPDNIPVDFFVKMRDMLPMPLKSDLSTKLATNRIVTELRVYSLANGTAQYLNIHRLVQEVVRKSHTETREN